MKKLLFACALLLFVLAGCSDKEPEKSAANEPTNENKETESTGQPASDTEATTDPVIAADPNKETKYFNEYTILARYENDGEALKSIDFDGYELNAAVLALEDPEGNQYLALVGETENKTDKTLQFNASTKFVTDKQDQAETEEGWGESAPTVKLKSAVTAELEYGVPDSFTMTIEAPFALTGENEYAPRDPKQDKTLEFKKE